MWAARRTWPRRPAAVISCRTAPIYEKRKKGVRPHLSFACMKVAVSSIDAALIDALYRRANGARWRAPKDRFALALEACAARAFAGAAPGRRELERHLSTLHLEDLALACACAAGED